MAAVLCGCIARVVRTSNGDGRLAAIGCVYRRLAPIGAIGWIENESVTGKCLKVPKCENFHRTDFFYFFTIKPLWVGDFRAKIKN